MSLRRLLICFAGFGMTSLVLGSFAVAQKNLSLIHI